MTDFVPPFSYVGPPAAASASASAAAAGAADPQGVSELDQYLNLDATPQRPVAPSPPPPPPPALHHHHHHHQAHDFSSYMAASSSPHGPSSPSGGSSSSSVDARSVASDPSSSSGSSSVGAGAKDAGDLDVCIKVEGGLGSPPAPVSSSSGVCLAELLEEQALKRKRLARKAELARRSRKRKKDRLDELEDEVAALKDELERERKRRRQAEVDMRDALREVRGGGGGGEAGGEAGSEAGPAAVAGAVAASPAACVPAEEGLAPTAAENAAAERAEADALETLRKSMEGCEAPPSAVRAQVEALLRIGERRGAQRTGTAHRVSQWVASAAPTPARFTAWALSRGDASFYERDDSLWRSLFAREIGASPDQMARLRALCHGPSAPNPAAVSGAAAAFEAAVREQNAAEAAAVRAVAGILTPDQAARFFVWVASYGNICTRI